MLDVERVDYVRIPSGPAAGEPLRRRSGAATQLGLAGRDGVVYEAGNVTLAVMTPHTHDDEFVPLPPGTIALRVPDVAEAKARLEAVGVEVAAIED